MIVAGKEQNPPRSHGDTEKTNMELIATLVEFLAAVARPIVRFFRDWRNVSK